VYHRAPSQVLAQTEQRTGGLRALLSNASAYALLQRAVGSERSYALFVDEYVRPAPGERVLDIGCGPGEILPFLPDVRYFGIDVSEPYIEAAREKYGERAEFQCADVRSADVPGASFDVVMVMGVIHHLDDAGARALFELASGALVDSGRLVAIEAVWTAPQHPFARWMNRRDRGAHIRTEDGYVRLAQHAFAAVRATVRTDLLRIPYTHVLIECEQPTR
jgi:SAM-dependent methyltransferase